MLELGLPRQRRVRIVVVKLGELELSWSCEMEVESLMQLVEMWGRASATFVLRAMTFVLNWLDGRQSLPGVIWGFFTIIKSCSNCA